jgi:hypothetical protein
MSFKCPFCNDPEVEINRDKNAVVGHLLVLKFKQGDDDSSHVFHVHGPIGNRVAMVEYIENILREAGIAFQVVSGQPEKENRTSEKE